MSHITCTNFATLTKGLLQTANTKVFVGLGNGNVKDLTDIQVDLSDYVTKDELETLTFHKVSNLYSDSRTIRSAITHLEFNAFTILDKYLPALKFLLATMTVTNLTYSVYGGRIPVFSILGKHHIGVKSGDGGTSGQTFTTSGKVYQFSNLSTYAALDYPGCYYFSNFSGRYNTDDEWSNGSSPLTISCESSSSFPSNMTGGTISLTIDGYFL